MQKLSLVDETFDLNFISEYHLSIQFSLDGLSFCILDGIQKKYVQLNHSPFVTGESPLLVKHIRDFYTKNEYLDNSFKSTQVIFSSPKATYIPLAYFQDEKKHALIELNFGETKKEIVLTNKLPLYDGEIAFGIPTTLSNFIDEKYPDIKINHECCPFIWNANNSMHSDNFMAVLIRKEYFWLIYTEKNQLKYINSFNYQTDDDILYFILNYVSSMEISTEKTPIFIEGMVSKKSGIYHRIRQFIKHVQLSGAYSEFHYSYLFNQIPDARFVTLLNMQACAL